MAHDLIITPHPLTLQGQTITQAVLAMPGESLGGVLARHGVDIKQQGWCIRVGGLEVPAALCSRTRVADGMVIEAHRVAGKSVVRALALVVLAYLTLQLGLPGAYLGLQGLPAYLVNVGAFVVGSMVINKLLPPPGMGSYGGARPGETYSLSGARNGARHYGPLGLLFGQVRVVPDFAAQPYAWFSGDEQYQYVQLHAGLNVDTVAELKIGDTAIESYDGVSVTRSGFATGNTGLTQWESVDTVAGGLLDAPTAPGDWVVRTSSPGTVQLHVDIVGQLQYINSGGNPQRFTVDLDIEYSVLPGGAWQPFIGSSSRVTVANSTTKPLRRSYSRVFSSPGQFAVRMRKATKNETRTQAANTVEWAALRSYQADTGTAVARQVVGIVIRASGQLNGTLDQVSWLATSSPCPVWNGSAWVTQTTSNPGALLLQFFRGKFDGARLLWGYGKPDSQIDLEGLKAFMVHCASNGYRFDHWFTEQASRREIAEAIAAAGMGSVSRHTGKLGVVYMASGQPIEAVINMANVRKGSFRVSYATRTTAEEIEVASPERTADWRAASVRVLAPGVTVPRETARLSPAGVTTQAGRLLAARSAMAQSLYGRKSVSWEMDLEHLTVRRFSLVALAHDVTQWAHGGRVQWVTDVAGVVTIGLDAEVPSGATPYVGLRLPGAQEYRVFQVVPFSGTARQLTLVGAWPVDLPYPDAGGEAAHNTLWIFDFVATPGVRLRVVDIAPTGNLSGARITAVPEPDAFWTYITSGAYTAYTGAAPTQPVVVSNVRVSAARLASNADDTAELSIAWDASGPYDHAQVLGAVGDDPLELLGESRTLRLSGWRVIRPGSVRVEVRGFDQLGRPALPVALTQTVVLDAPLRPGRNLLPVDEWRLGMAAASAYPFVVGAWRMFSGAPPAGATGDMLLEPGPDGQPGLVWRVTAGSGGGDQGGFLREPPDRVDETQAYRLHVWLQRSGDGSGSVLIGSSNTENMAAAAESYFSSISRSTMVAGRWYLAAGYVYPASHAGAQTYRGGVWDAETGVLLQTLSDLRWVAGADACRWAMVQYGTDAPGGAGATTRFAQPAVYLVDGTEPSIASMLGSARAGAAKATADSALSQATAANTELGKIASDNILTRGEKPQVILDASAIDAERPGILARASGYGITTERTAYDDAVTGLFTYLAGLSPDYDDVSQDTTIVGSTFRLNFGTVYATRQALLNKIAELAGTTAVWASVSGTGKPADNATKNTVTYSATAPASPGNGDVWVDTSTTPHTTKVRVAGAWQVGANLSTGALAQLDSVATAQIAAGAVHDIVVLYDAAGYFESNAS